MLQVLYNCVPRIRNDALEKNQQQKKLKYGCLTMVNYKGLKVFFLIEFGSKNFLDSLLLHKVQRTFWNRGQKKEMCDLTS